MTRDEKAEIEAVIFASVLNGGLFALWQLNIFAGLFMAMTTFIVVAIITDISEKIQELVRYD
jgi:hypothetical protein